jgi:hypothetical protein
MKNEQWEIVEAKITPAWNRKTEDGSYSLKDGDELVGIYLGKKEDVGPNNSVIYEFKVDGETKGVWGSTVLDTRLGTLEEGMEVRIIYKGKATSEKTKRTYHDFDIFKREAVKEDIPVIDEDNTTDGIVDDGTTGSGMSEEDSMDEINKTL